MVEGVISCGQDRTLVLVPGRTIVSNIPDTIVGRWFHRCAIERLSPVVCPALKRLPIDRPFFTDDVIGWVIRPADVRWWLDGGAVWLSSSVHWEAVHGTVSDICLERRIVAPLERNARVTLACFSLLPPGSIYYRGSFPELSPG